MDPITLALIYFLGTIGAAAIIYIAYLSINKVRDYIRAKRSEKHINSEAVILKRKLAEGKTRVVVNFMDEGSDGMQVWDADELDSNLERLPDNEAIIIKS